MVEGERTNAPGAIGSMVCGIISIVVWLLPVGGLVLGIIAIVLSGKARRAIRDEPKRYEGGGMATAGFVCGIIGTVLGTLYVLYWIVAIVAISGEMNDARPTRRLF